VRVLVCDDAEPVRHTLTRALRASAGHTVDEAATAEEALAILRATRVDVVVMDHDLPGMSGLDAVRSLRARGGATPVLLLTGDAGVRDLIRDDDAVAHLVKGEVSMAEVVAVVGRLALTR
jgi:two-component system response regulator TctD